jgi:hypothetical protein
MRRYLSVISDGLLAGLAYIGLNKLVGDPIPFHMAIASAIGVAICVSLLKYFRPPRQSPQ